MLSKPSIEFSKNGKPAEAPRGNHSAGEAIMDASGKKQICSYNYVSGEILTDLRLQMRQRCCQPEQDMIADSTLI